MTAPSLSFDTSRCSGWHNLVNGTLQPVEPCAGCLRRMAPGGMHQVWMQAPALVDGACMECKA